MSLPESVLGAVDVGGGVHVPALRRPLEAIVATREDVVTIIEKGWPLVSKRCKAFPLADLPFKDGSDIPEGVAQSRPISIGGPLMPLKDVPNRACGKQFYALEIGNLQQAWAILDEKAAEEADKAVPA